MIRDLIDPVNTYVNSLTQYGYSGSMLKTQYGRIINCILNK